MKGCVFNLWMTVFLICVLRRTWQGQTILFLIHLRSPYYCCCSTPEPENNFIWLRHLVDISDWPRWLTLGFRPLRLLRSFCCCRGQESQSPEWIEQVRGKVERSLIFRPGCNQPRTSRQCTLAHNQDYQLLRQHTAFRLGCRSSCGTPAKMGVDSKF